eukprot:7504003-Pyramimonas_sp.AAC.1
MPVAWQAMMNKGLNANTRASTIVDAPSRLNFDVSTLRCAHYFGSLALSGEPVGLLHSSH